MMDRKLGRAGVGVFTAIVVALVLPLLLPNAAAAQEDQIEGALHAEVPGLAQLITADSVVYSVDPNGLNLAEHSHTIVRITGAWSGDVGTSVFIAASVEPLPDGELPGHQVIDEIPTADEEAALVARAEREGIGVNPTADLQQADAAEAAANSHLVGSWSAVQNWPVIPIFTTMMYDGRVLAYDSVSDLPTEQDPNQTTTRATVWDPYTNSFTNVQVNTGFNIFCSGFASMVDGTVFIAGGNRDQQLNGLPTTHTFTPRANQWARTNNMSFARWYPSVTQLPNAELLITGGGPATPEVRQTNGAIRQLTSAAQNYWANRDYPWLQTAPDGRVAFVGPSNQMGLINTGGSGSWQATNRRDNIYRGYGSYAMYTPSRVLVAGGATQSASHDMRSSVVINLDNNTSSNTGNMNFRRRQHNLTVLADGKVLATGGLSSNAGLVDLNNPVYAAEVWDPTTGQWTVLSAEARARQYHSSAVLLPDGRVLSGGGGICGDCQRFGYIQKNAQIFSPPYLYKTDGSGQLADRPAIDHAPSRLGYNESFTVEVSPASGTSVAKVTMVRPSSTTHSQNQTQRYVPLNFSDQGSGRIAVTAPNNANTAPPGHYMLFVIDSAGVPSVSRMIQVVAGGGDGSRYRHASRQPRLRRGVLDGRCRHLRHRCRQRLRHR